LNKIQSKYIPLRHYSDLMRDYVTLNGVRLHYKVTGEGRNVIVLHGWGCSIETVRSICQLLENDFRVYALDFPGFGKSSEPSSVWGSEEYTAIVEAFVGELQIDDPILIGHSHGGRVSILYASRNKTRKVILIDAAGVKPKRNIDYYLKVYSYKLAKKLAPILLGKEKARQKLEAYRKKKGSADYNAASGIMRQILVKLVNEDLRQVMHHIKAPTLLIWGENDTDTPLRSARIMKKKIKGSGLVVLKNAGHYSFLDDFYTFKAVLNSFLEKDKRSVSN